MSTPEFEKLLDRFQQAAMDVASKKVPASWDEMKARDHYANLLRAARTSITGYVSKIEQSETFQLAATSRLARINELEAEVARLREATLTPEENALLLWVIEGDNSEDLQPIRDKLLHRLSNIA